MLGFDRGWRLEKSDKAWLGIRDAYQGYRDRKEWSSRSDHKTCRQGTAYTPMQQLVPCYCRKYLEHTLAMLDQCPADNSDQLDTLLSPLLEDNT